MPSAADEPRAAAFAAGSLARAAVALGQQSPRIASGARPGRPTERVLTAAHRLAARLARRRAVIEIDDGWSDDRDVSVPDVGRWAWLDVAGARRGPRIRPDAAAREHALRPTGFGILSAVTLATALLIAAVAGVALRWPLIGASAAVVTVALVARDAAWRTAQVDGNRSSAASEAVAARIRHDSDEARARHGRRSSRRRCSASYADAQRRPSSS